MAGIKKERSYVLDFWKFFACMLVALAHYGTYAGGYANGTQTAGGIKATWDYLGSIDYSGLSFPWPLGIYSLGFFYFTTGYWLVHAFKKLQRSHALNKGNDMELVYRYTAKNYSTYMPILFFATAISFVTAHILNGSSLRTWVSTFVWDIWEFFGLSGFGLWTNSSSGIGLQITAGAGTVLPDTPYSFFAGGWYILAIAVYACIFFVLFVVNEKLTVFGILPLFLSMSLLNLKEYIAMSAGQVERFGLMGLLDKGFTVLWGPAVLGMWGWYVVDALKRIDISQKAKKLIGIGTVAAYLLLFVEFFVGYFGGMCNFDVHIMIICVLTLANIDPFTQSFNKLLNKLPFAKYMGDIGLGVYVVQFPIIAVLYRLYLPQNGPAKTGYLFIVLCVVGGILWTALYRTVIAKMQDKLSQLFLLKNPIGNIFGEKKDEAPAKA